MHVPESAPKNRWYVPPGFTITEEGEYLHFEHKEAPITVRNTTHERGSDMMDGRE